MSTRTISMEVQTPFGFASQDLTWSDIRYGESSGTIARIDGTCGLIVPVTAGSPGTLQRWRPYRANHLAIGGYDQLLSVAAKFTEITKDIDEDPPSPPVQVLMGSPYATTVGAMDGKTLAGLSSELISVRAKLDSFTTDEILPKLVLHHRTGGGTETEIFSHKMATPLTDSFQTIQESVIIPDFSQFFTTNGVLVARYYFVNEGTPV